MLKNYKKDQNQKKERERGRKLDSEDLREILGKEQVNEVSNGERQIERYNESVDEERQEPNNEWIKTEPEKENRNAAPIRNSDMIREPLPGKDTLILIGVIIDATLSFTTVFPAISFFMEEFTTRIKSKRKELKGCTFKYGLTTLHDKAEVLKLSGDDFFTEDENMLMNAVNGITFNGGSEDGYEDLNAAIWEQLRVLNTYKDNKYASIYRGILMFSDSTMDKNQRHNFDGDTIDNIENHGVRIAEFYTYDTNFRPKMKMVDGSGYETSDDKNSASYNRIHSLLEGGVEGAINEAMRIIVKIINQNSINTAG